jgi:hypothetical protein
VRWYTGIKDKHFVKEALGSITQKNGVMVFSSKNAAMDFANRHITRFGENKHMANTAELTVRWYLFSKALKTALDNSDITIKDFSRTDAYVMSKIKASRDKDVDGIFNLLRKPIDFKCSNTNPKIVLRSKFRYTDPTFIEGKQLHRVTEVSKDYRKRIANGKKRSRKGLGISYLDLSALNRKASSIILQSS